MAALRLNLAESEGKKAAAVETELDDLRQDLKEAKYEISSLQAKYSAQTKHFNEVERLLEAATEKRQQTVAEVKQLKRELQETKAEREKLTIDAREAQKEMQEKAGMFLSLWLSSSTLCGYFHWEEGGQLFLMLIVYYWFVLPRIKPRFNVLGQFKIKSWITS